MTKTAKKTEPTVAERLGAGAPPKLIELDLRERDIEKCRRHLTGRLRSNIFDVAETGDSGLIANLVADLKALDHVLATKPDVVPVEPVRILTAEEARVEAVKREQREAAADPAKMQEYNRRVAIKEKHEAARAEAS